MTTPLPTDQFALGTPFRLGAYDAGELRGPHYYVATGGYLRRVGPAARFHGRTGVRRRLARERRRLRRLVATPRWRTNGGVGLVMDTLLGPVIVAGSWSFDGRWPTYLGIGRTFR